MEQSALSAVNSEPVKAFMPVVLRLTGMSLRAEKREIRDRQAKERFVLAQADSPEQAAELGRPSGFDSDYLRQRYQRSQQNREAIALKAVSQVSLLPGGPFLKTPNSEWLDHFCDACETVGDDSMQELWARALCLECSATGSFGKRSIAALRLMDRREAEAVQLIASRAIQADRSQILVENHLIPDDKYSVVEEALLRAEAIGLLTGARNGISSISDIDVEDTWIIATRFLGGGHIQALKPRGLRYSRLQINGWAVSDVGVELMRLPLIRTDERLATDLAVEFRSMGFSVEFVP